MEDGNNSGSRLWFRGPVCRFRVPVFCNASCIFVMHPFFHNAPIFRSALTHYKKMSILSGVMHNKVLHFFVVRRHITKNTIQKYVAHSISHL